MLCFPQQKKLVFSTNFSDLFHITDSNSGATASLIELKIPKLTPDLKDHLNTEIIFLRSHKDSNLIQLKDFSFSANGCSLTLDETINCSLTTYIVKKGVLNENQALSKLANIVRSYDFYKKENMLPRDFALDNIWLSADEIKIVDLGLMRKFINEKENEIQFCKAPEIFFEGNQANKYDSEVWSLGIILFYMLFGNFPWRGKSENGFFNAVRDLPLKIPSEKQHLNQKTTILLTKMLTFDPNKRISWNELKKNELLQLFQPKDNFDKKNNEKEVDSPETKWKFNIYSFYCKNDYILKNSFMDEKQEKENKKMYPSLDENMKSLSQCENIQTRISVNMRKVDDKQIKLKNEEKRIIDIDSLIQKLIDANKMNFSLKQDSQYQNKNPKKIPSTFMPNQGESVFQPKIVQSSFNDTSIQKNIPQQITPNKESVFQKNPVHESTLTGSLFGRSMFPGQSVFNSINKKEENIFDKNLEAIQNQIEKYNVFGRTIGDSELVFRKIVDLELWGIQRFLLMKKLIKFRLALGETLLNGENLLNLPKWDDFIKCEKFQNLSKKLQNENIFLQKDFEKLYHKTAKGLKKYQMNETKRIEKFLNLDLTQNFDSLFFIILFLHAKTIGPKVDLSLKYNDIDKALKMMMHKTEIIDCLIINELEFMTDIPDYFSFHEFETAIDSLKIETLKEYAEKKEKILEIWRPKYIPDK